MPRLPASCCRGFSLVELLATIAIVAVLAAVSGSAYLKAARLADRTRCLQNLRQIGVALGACAADHDGYLPTILTSWMGPVSRINNSQAATALATYLGGSPPTATSQTIPAFVCPAWKRKFGTSYPEGPSYWGVFLLRRLSDNQHIYPYVSPFGKTGASNTQPLTLVQLSTLPDFSASKQWAVQDCDQINYGAGGSTTPGLSPVPVHTDGRNVLYFDFHVETVPASTVLQ